MTTETAAIETKHPQLLADGEVYAVRVGSQWFSRFDEDGFLWLANVETCFTKDGAISIAKKIGKRAKAVLIRKKLLD